MLPIHRGMKLSKDDKIRQHATQQLRTYWKIDFEDFKKRFGINCKDYFSKEIESLAEMANDGLLKITESAIILTKVGYDFAQFITNHFDVYDPPDKSYNDRLTTIQKAKEAQEKSIEYFKSL